MTDPRITKLEELAESEGLQLPMAPQLIVWLEERGYVVCLHSGKASRPTVGLPTASGRAVSHLLAHEVGEVAL
jgi:hypothetical protein